MKQMTKYMIMLYLVEADPSAALADPLSRVILMSLLPKIHMEYGV